LKLQFRTDKQELFLEEMAETIASDSINHITASFTFDAIWNNLAKTAVFCLDPRNLRDDNTWAVVLDSNGKCRVPQEVLQNRGRFWVGVFGVHANNLRVTSTMVRVEKERGAWYNSAFIPDLTIWEQLLAMTSWTTQEIVHMQDRLIAGANITITNNGNRTQTISAADLELFVIVTTLPATGQLNRIYLVPDSTGGFDEWAFINNKWVNLGKITITDPGASYEYGTWTPSLVQRAEGGWPAFNQPALMNITEVGGRWTKIGNRIWCTGRITGNIHGAVTVDTLLIGLNGLPFPTLLSATAPGGISGGWSIVNSPSIIANTTTTLLPLGAPHNWSGIQAGTITPWLNGSAMTDLRMQFISPTTPNPGAEMNVALRANGSAGDARITMRFDFSYETGAA